MHILIIRGLRDRLRFLSGLTPLARRELAEILRALSFK